MHTFTLEWLIHQAPLTCTQIDDKFVPARPMEWPGFKKYWYRLKAAWEIMCGRADAFTWPGGQ